MSADSSSDVLGMISSEYLSTDSSSDVLGIISSEYLSVDSSSDVLDIINKNQSTVWLSRDFVAVKLVFLLLSYFGGRVLPSSVKAQASAEAGWA